MFRRALVVLLSSLACSFVVAPAEADYYSEVSIFSALSSFPDQTVGGWSEEDALASAMAVETFPDFVQSYSAFARTSSALGIVTSAAVAGGDNAAPGSRIAGSGSADNRLIDRYAIGAGDSGLADGAPAEVRVQARLTGAVRLEGRPSGTSITNFRVTAVTPLVNYTTAGLNPPQDFDVDLYWEHDVAVTIGDNLTLDVLMATDLGGVGMDPDDSVHNYMVFSGEVRVIPAPGFEGIELTSDSNAPGTPMTPPDDADADGVANLVDNCVLRPNASQEDSDADGLGNACDPDLNGDCVVNVVDLGLLKSVFFTADADADFNGDGVVNAGDLGIMKSFFFARPGPSAQPHSCHPAVHAAGTITVDPTFAIDLDAGAVSGSAAPPVDVIYSVEFADNLSLRPVNGAALGSYGNVEPDFTQCAATPVSPVRVNLWALDIGDYVCALTDAGRIGRLRIVGIADPPLGTASALDIEFTIWEL